MPAPEQKYRIIDKIDSGGMAEIYRAEAEMIQGMKKQVAIKRILPHLTLNAKFVAMFLDEARLSLYLNHANIVHVYDIGRSGDTYFIVMEYVNGINLRALAESVQRENGFSVAEALFITMEICKGLGYAHDMCNPDDGGPLNIVHRDVSPPNILLSLNGEVKLTDFGLAKAATQIEVTDPGIVKGKFSYLSPEAASGYTVDFRSDIFACGIILFEILTGRRLFLGESDYQTVELVRASNIPSISALNKDVPPELENIVFKALARDPDDRFQHAYEFQDALAQFLFARGLKITSRDIAQQVRHCVQERSRTQPHKALKLSVIDALIKDELTKFTSLDASALEAIGSSSIATGSTEGSGPLDPDDFLEYAHNLGSEIGLVENEPENEITSLESVLETASGTHEIPRPPEKNQPKAGRSKTLLIIFILLFFVLAVSAVLVLHYFELIPLM
ncbi:MAG: serine/threonine-protein kinase [Pseudomonadota bacterium]